MNGRANPRIRGAGPWRGPKWLYRLLLGVLLASISPQFSLVRAADVLSFGLKARGGQTKELSDGGSLRHTLTMNVDCSLVLTPQEVTCGGDRFDATHGSLTGTIRFWGSATDHAGTTYNYDIDGPVNFGAGSRIDSSFTPRGGDRLYWITREEFWIPSEGYVPYAFEYVSDQRVLRVWIALPSPFSYSAEFEHYDIPAQHVVQGEDQARSCLLGTVTDGSGHPVTGAAVTFGGVQQTSDASGTFHYAKIPRGNYDLVLRKLGYEDFLETISIPAMDILVRPFEMRPAISLSGVVVNGWTKAPIPGAEVLVASTNALTDASGKFEFRGLPAGNTTLQISKLGYSSAKFQLSLPEASPQPRLIELIPFGEPSIVAIEAREFPGFLHFLEGVPMTVDFDLEVNWGSHPLGTIEYYSAPRFFRSEPAGLLNTLHIDVGSAIPVGQTLEAIGISSDGARSRFRAADFLVIPPPFQGGAFSKFAAHREGKTYVYETAGSFNQGFFDQVIDSGLVPDGTPMLEGLSFSLGFVPAIDCSVDSNGRAEVGLRWSNLPDPDDEDTDAVMEDAWKAKPLVGRLVSTMKLLLAQRRIDPALLPRAVLRLPCQGDASSVSLFPYLKGELQCNDRTLKWENQAFEVGMAGEWSPNFNCYSILPVGTIPLPVFWQGAFTASGSLGGRVTTVEPIQWSAVGNFGIEGRLAGGVGIDDILSAEIWGKGSVSWDFRWPEKPYLVSTTGEVLWGYELHALLWSWSQPLGVWKWPKPPTLASPAKPTPTSPVFQPLPRGRDGVPGTARFLGTSTSHRKVRLQANPANATPREAPTPLITDTFPYADLDLSGQDGTATLVWLHDDAERPAENRTVVRSSTYAEGKWTEPQDIDSDGTPDFHPRVLRLPGGRALAVWEDGAKALDSGSTFEDAIANAEISAAWFDPEIGRWQPATSLSSNQRFDRSPRIAATTVDAVAVLWVHNAGNQLLGSPEHPDTILSSFWTGKVWSAPQPVTQFAAPVLRYTVAVVDDVIHVVYSIDADGRRDTPYDHELYYQRHGSRGWEDPVRLTFDDLPDENPQLFADPGGHLTLTWCRGGELSLVREFDLSDRRVVWRGEISAGLADFRALASNGEVTALVWIGPGTGTGSEIWMVRKDPAGDSWGEAKQLTSDETIKGPLTGGVLDEESLLLLFGRKAPPSPSDLAIARGKAPPSPSASRKPVDIYQYFHRDAEDPGLVADSFSVWPPNPRPGQEVQFRLSAANWGDLPRSNLVVRLSTVANGQTVQLARVAIHEPLRAGATTPLEGTFRVPISSRPVTLRAEIELEGDLDDSNRDNNSLELALLLPDPKIASATWRQLSSNQWSLRIVISNVGGSVSAAGQIEVVEASLTQPPLGLHPTEALASGASQEVELSLSLPPDLDAKDLMVRLAGAAVKEDWNTSNNSLRLRLQAVRVSEDLRLALTPGFPSGHPCVLVFADQPSAFVLEVSDDLKSWRPVREVQDSTAVTRVCDDENAPVPARFYRARRLR